MDIVTAIVAINSKASVTCVEEDYDRLTWHNGTEVISKEDIVAKQKELKVEYDALDYSRKRKTAYDKLNQFELISDGGTIHKDAIAVIKKKYPKPE